MDNIQLKNSNKKKNNRYMTSSIDHICTSYLKSNPKNTIVSDSLKTIFFTIPSKRYVENIVLNGNFMGKEKQGNLHSSNSSNSFNSFNFNLKDKNNQNGKKKEKQKQKELNSSKHIILEKFESPQCSTNLLSPIKLDKTLHHSLSNSSQKRLNIAKTSNINFNSNTLKNKNTINEKLIKSTQFANPINFKKQNAEYKSSVKGENDIDVKKVRTDRFYSQFPKNPKIEFLSLINPCAYNLINDKDKEKINYQYIKMIRKAKQQKIKLRNNLNKLEMLYFNKSKVEDPECSRQFRHQKNTILASRILLSYYSLRKLPNPF